MGDVVNPVVPVWFDIVWFAVAAIVIALMVVALIDLVRAVRRLPFNLALFWTLVVVLVPVLGPIAWLTIGRRPAVAE